MLGFPVVPTVPTTFVGDVDRTEVEGLGGVADCAGLVSTGLPIGEGVEEDRLRLEAEVLERGEGDLTCKGPSLVGGIGLCGWFWGMRAGGEVNFLATDGDGEGEEVIEGEGELDVEEGDEEGEGIGTKACAVSWAVFASLISFTTDVDTQEDIRRGSTPVHPPL